MRAGTGAVPHRRPAGLRERVGTAGYTYQERELDGANPDRGTGTLGYTDPTARTIVVDARLTDHQKASVIAHELGHVHTGHVDSSPQEYRRLRGQMEPMPKPLLHHLPQTGIRPRQVRRGRSSGPRREASPAASTGGSARRVDREQTHAIRLWPKENGYEVSEQGRTSKAVVDAFATAH